MVLKTIVFAAEASQPNIFETYRNKAVKEITGFTINYCLTNEIILEAKRLLVHTDKTQNQ